MNSIQNDLIQYYNQNKRDFPWRLTQDPYLIWISEIMLQQTTTSAVIPYYNRFIERFPDVKTLANASIDEVYKYWEGLGYYRRAKHLHETANIIVSKYNSQFPETYDDIISLKGIGHYTAGAICSISYNMPIAAVDGNALRIMSRVLNIKDNIALNSTQKKFKDHIEILLKDCEPSLFNQALMDLGATICKPKNPKCEICPIMTHCLAHKENQQNVLPINIKTIKHKEESHITGIITYKDKLMLIKNSNGLLENLFGFIQYNVESPYSFIEKFKKDFHLEIDIIASISTVKHVFTHKTWYMNVYEFKLEQPNDHLYSLDELQDLAISTAHIKVLKSYLKSKEL